MATTAALTTAGVTAVVKKAIDDLYQMIKDAGVNQLGKIRSDLKEPAIVKTLVSITNVKTLWNVDKEVSLYKFYHPSRILNSERENKKFEGLKDFGSRQNYVIQGTAGQGKSIFLRYLCGQELRPDFSSNRVPIFIELRRIRASFGVKSLIFEALQKFKLPYNEQAWGFLASTGKFVVLMDAFDEIDPAFASSAIDEIELLADLYGEALQIIVSSRPDADIQHSSRFRVCKLAPLKTADHLPFLKKICTDKIQADSIKQVLDASSTDIKGLLTTPLMLTLLVILYKSIQTIPDTVPKFYEELFDVLFYRHDHSKPGFRRKRHTQLDDTKLKKLFSAFCFYVRINNLGVLSNEQLSACTEHAAKACSVIVDSTKFKDEMVKTVCLMMQDGFEISFIHKSVIQYYAASFVSSSSDAFAAKFYLLAAKPGNNWTLELKFLSQIDNYRFISKYEIPRLNRIMQRLQLSVDDEEKNAAILNEYLIEGMEALTLPRINELMAGEVPALDRLLAFLPKVKDDCVLQEFGPQWMTPISSKVLLNEKFREAMFAVMRKDGVENGQRMVAPAVKFRELIDEQFPNLAMDTLRKFRRHQEAVYAVIKTEDEKTEMLARLI